MTPKFSKKDIKDYIRFGMEMWLCVKEQYPEAVKKGEMIRVEGI